MKKESVTKEQIEEMSKDKVLELTHDNIIDLVTFYKDKYKRCKVKASEDAIKRLDELYIKLTKGE